MPPAQNAPLQNRSIDTGHMLSTPTPTHEQSSIGPIVGAIIIILMLALGALYFWGAHLNKQSEQLPLIPADNSASAAQ